ncbi:MAG: hypothetical protein QOG72_3125 [Sphingomonadales bacterium]|jgi:hypothetical protein|nr:hypothetical protein [Sphingomonadales bacterium]
MPAKAGIHAGREVESGKPEWAPAFTGGDERMQVQRPML